MTLDEATDTKTERTGFCEEKREEKDSENTERVEEVVPYIRS